MAPVRRGQRSQGAKLFAATGKTQATLAAELDVSTGIVAFWQSGKRTPNLPNRQAIHELYGIPVVAWDQAPTDERGPRAGAASAGAEPGTSTFESRVSRLDLEASDALDRLKADKSITTLERVKAVESLGKTLIQLRRLRGEDASEVRVLHHPRWIELRTAILEVLTRYPDALRDVIAAVSPSDAERTRTRGSRP